MKAFFLRHRKLHLWLLADLVLLAAFFLCRSHAGIMTALASGATAVRLSLIHILTGFLDQEAVGLVGFCPERQAAENAGWISLFYIREPYRRRGYGVQLLGQAVAHYRPLGRRCLRIALTPEESARCPFFRDYGFVPVSYTHLHPNTRPDSF